MSAEQFPSATQNERRLCASADLAALPAAPVCAALAAGSIKPGLAQRGAHLLASVDQPEARPSCQQSLNLTFFFDGTGNNLEADLGSFEHSNVARLFLAHEENNKATGRYKIYIPGIGTYFKEIGDPGGTTTGLAFGAEGDARLEWAFGQFDEKLAYHVALAQNPSNKIKSIRVAAFGFSRGATLARAFARMFQERCEQRGGEWVLKSGAYPVSFYFLGLWDTVASVGFPMSANNSPVTQSAGLTETQTVMAWREPSAAQLAFGQPGADPAPGPADGHMGWAHPLDVVSMVEQCVHMIAGHEVRNSFPVDSCLRGASYPSSVREMVYPGVHSDVGGGYRPGEGARSLKPAQMLSLIPLRVMHKLAYESGVALYPINAFPDPKVAQYYAADESSQPDFDKLSDLWSHYMAAVGHGGKGVGEMMNAHMGLYYAWRFYRIRQNQAAQSAGQDTQDAVTLKQSEREWKQESDALKREIGSAKADADAANRRRQVATNRLNEAREAEFNYGQPVNPILVTACEQAKVDAEAPNDKYLKLQARYDTLPGTEGQLARNLTMYDQQLLADAQAIRQRQLDQPSLVLRPHYKNLLAAYEAEFIRDQGLRDEKIIEFFSSYVHDSLAGFARDATLPSDPRVVYVGDDVKSKHSMLMPMNSKETAAA